MALNCRYKSSDASRSELYEYCCRDYRLTPTSDALSNRQVESKFSASQSYGLDKSRFHFADSVFDLALGLASNLLGWMPWLWDVSAGLVAKWGFENRGGDIPTSLVFVGLATIAQVGL